MKTLKIGPRIIKTGVAIALAIFISQTFLPNTGGILAGIAALNSTLPSLKKSYESLSNRMFGTLIGAIIATVIIFLFSGSPFPLAMMIGLAAIMTITTLNALKLSEVNSLAVMAVIAIMIGGPNEIWFNAFNRVMETFIGVLCSFVINWLILPPKYDSNFISVLEYINSEILRLIRASLRRNADYSLTHKDLKLNRQYLKKLDNYFNLIKSEVVFGNQKRVEFTRKLVIFRQLKTTTLNAVNLLDVLHHNSNLFNELPKEMRILIRERIETLLVAHEQIFLKLSGKVQPNSVNFIEITPEYRELYLTTFYNQIWLWRDEMSLTRSKSNQLLNLMNAIYLFEDELKTLNRLMKNYKIFHEKGYLHEFDHNLSDSLSL